MRVVLVEDDGRMRSLVRRGLEEQGYDVETAESGPAAVELLRVTSAEAVILDLMLPGFDGVEVVSRMRAASDRRPVLMLTARDAPADVVRCLDAGADDYLVKPFPFAVLLARLRALIRRGPAVHGVRLEVEGLSLDPRTRQVSRGGIPVALTRTEFNLLEYLMRRAGRVVTRRVLIEAVWGAERLVKGNTLDAFVKSLRAKLRAAGGARLIQTVRGVGYSLREEPES